MVHRRRPPLCSVLYFLHRVMAIERADLPTDEAMKEWNTHRDVADHFSADVDDIKAVLESLGASWLTIWRCWPLRTRRR